MTSREGCPSIRAKINRLVVGIAAVALLATSLGLFANEVLGLRRSLVADLSTLTTILGTNGASALTSFDAKSAEQTLRSLRGIPHVLVAEFLTTDGRGFARYLRPGTPDRAEDESGFWSPAIETGRPEAHRFEEGRARFLRRIDVDGQPVGWICIASDLSQLEGRLRWYAGVAAAVLAAAALLAWALSARLQGLITRPVFSLLDTVRSVARDHDGSLRAPKETSDELGALVDGFNEVLSRLQARDAELAAHRAGFEAQVEAQTAALSAANQELEDTAAQLREAKAEAEAAGRAESRFLANMSREIGAPMSGVLGMLELLQGSELAPLQRRLGDAARRSAENLLDSINKINGFSEAEAGKPRLEVVDFEVRDVVDEVLDLFCEHAHGKGLEVLCDVPADLPATIRGEPGRVRQVLSNLVDNAVKFTERGEIEIRVTTQEASGSTVCLRFEVRDTGIGVGPEAQETLFGPFSQAGGTGRGLAVSQQIVQRMAGEIGVASTPGGGSTFWFTACFGVQEIDGDGDGTEPPLEGLRVLVVDDNATNREILRHQLDGWRVANDAVDGGARALRVLHDATDDGRPYDLGIIDLLMPGMDGLDLARAVGSDPQVAGLPLIMLTSVGSPDEEELRRAGVALCLEKPVRLERLRGALRSVLSAPRPSLEA